MSLRVVSANLKALQLAFKGLKMSITGTSVQERHRNRYIRPKFRPPPWLPKQFRVKYDEMLSPENKDFLEEMVFEQYGRPGLVGGVQTYLHSPLKKEPILRGEWFPNCRRSGLIGVKLGTLLQWSTDGKPLVTTLIQIVDNHVIKYIPPEEFKVTRKKYTRRFFKEGKLGCLVVGSVNCNPQMFTREYNALFAQAGIMPKRLLTRFPIHPCAAIQPGTPLFASHFKISDAVDITGKTVYRGFQGVMKRWGFHGNRATHGTTKTHRRPGNIGAGGGKARVWPGTKLPGEVGNKMVTVRGIKIVKIDHKYNVIYVNGRSIPGQVNSFVYLHDTVLPRKRLKDSPHFPTYYPEDHVNNPRPEEEYDEKLFNFANPTIVFQEEKAKKKK